MNPGWRGQQDTGLGEAASQRVLRRKPVRPSTHPSEDSGDSSCLWEVYTGSQTRKSVTCHRSRILLDKKLDLHHHSVFWGGGGAGSREPGALQTVS